MNPHDFMTLHAAKTVEYLIAVSYLLLFIPFWRFVNRAPAQPAVAHARVAQKASDVTDLFAVPGGRFFHPGHAWLRVDGPDLVTVGFDDFAGKLVGAASALLLPPVGQTVAQGSPAWSLVADGRQVDMLSPVDGTVVAVNEHARRQPGLAHDQPYDAGWLLTVQSARLAANLKQLLSGQAARRWMDGLTERLQLEFTPAFGHVAQDGGMVVDGLARAIDPEAWDDVARRFFLTDGGGDHA
jgi:glycine cleavage system H lipoate-binding protein